MFVLKRKFLIVSVLIVTGITFLVCLFSLSVNNAEETDGGRVRIVLDAGHGGIDNGVVGTKTKVKESELNLKVVKKIEKYLSDAGIDVVLTRNSDAGLYGIATKNLKRNDMEARKKIIENALPTAVVSIHMNKYSLSSRRGAQVFFCKDNENSKILANSIQEVFNGMEDASRTCSALSGDYYIIKCSKYPSVICECGFLSNSEDEALLVTDEYQDKIAYEIFKGIVSYLAKTSFNYFS